ncbi:MAG TPA: GYF domain-containing protein [Polyangia bacterium]|jgi:predicted Zn finger-like uncharacterized protein|nr:GYF domain-containing protein [Polyangia bacterium]
MKIVCDSCATKYSISDDKVRGKVFKIRCKKCSHIIVVRGTNDAMTPATATPSALVQDGWHLVVDGDQVGPLPEADIRARLSRGEINAETYIWKDGFADWLKLSAVPEFAVDLATANASGMPSSAASGDLFSEGQLGLAADSGAARSGGKGGGGGGGGGLFAGIDAADAALAHGASGEADAFSPPISAVSRGGGADLFSAHAARPAADDGGWGSGTGGGGMAGHDGGRVENLTAQRHENSVLFSLANLQSLAMPSSGGGGAKPAASSSSGSAAGSEGSGLIDIRAMAATTLGSSSDSKGFGDDLPAFGAFSPAAPMLLEMPTGSGPSKWIYPAIGLLIVLVGGIAFMAYNIMTSKPAVVAEIPAVPVVAPAPPAAGGAPAKSAAPSPAAVPAATPEKPAIPDEKLPPREAPRAADSKPEKPAATGIRRGFGKGPRERKVAAAGDTEKRPGGGASAGATPAAAVEPTEKKAAKGSLDDLLESALNGKQKGAKPRVDDDSSSRRAAAAAEPASSVPLSKAAVVGGMNGVKPKISECYNQFKVPGMAMVTVIIGKNGKVSSATVTGKFAGTPTGSCVERAVKTAAFPPSDGLTTPYPFTLK